jgi:AraC-like DNA-binding protein
MHIPFEILLLTSSVGALQSAFFGIYFAFSRKLRSTQNSILVGLLIAFSLRMFKSVSYYFASGHKIPSFAENIGYAAHLAIGPLTWYYVMACLKQHFKFSWIGQGIHLLPTAIVLLLLTILKPHFWLSQNGYTLALIQMGIYFLVCFFEFWKSGRQHSKKIRQWLFILITGCSLVWAAYAMNYFTGMLSYIAAPVIFSLFIYIMTYIGLKNSNNFITREVKYQNSAFSTEEINQLFNKIPEWLEKTKAYTDPLLTMPKLAKQLSVSPNLLSRAINEKSKKSFPDFINSFRVKEAQIMLANPALENQKIASIAFETGFNTLSAFNSAFKKVTGTTPSEYRKKIFKGSV